MKAPIAMITVCGALALAGCGDSSTDPGATAGSTQAEAPNRESATTEAEAPKRPPRKKVAGLKGLEPIVKPPPGPPPKKLVIKDLKKGSGEEAKTGDEITVQFAGIEYNGKPIDSSWTLGGPFEFKLGSSVSSPGWEKGLPGMRVGGRRELIMPWYTTTTFPSENSEKEAWVYVFDLLEVR